MAKTDASIDNMAKPADEASPENLDKVRDILFGGQMRTVEARLKGVEERLSHEQELMRAEFTKRVTDLDAYARKEMQALHERIADENDARLSALTQLTAEIRDAHKAIDKRHATLEENTSLSDAELRDQLMAQATAASAALAHAHERLSAELQKSHESLSSAKTDRTALASLLTDLATSLSDEPTKGNGKG